MEMEPVAERNAFCKQSFQGLLKWLGDRCIAQLTATDDRTAVGDFIVRLAQDFEREVGDRLRSAGPDDRDELERIAAHLASCASGFRASPHDPMARLDAWSREVTASCYEHQPDAVVGSQIRDRLAVMDTLISGSDGPPPEAVPLWWVYSEARFQVTGGPVWSVELSLGLPLPSASWQAASYLLLHEFVSHVGQGPWSADCRQPKSDDPYAEGWMDYVAYVLHALYLNGGGPVSEDVAYELPDEPYMRSMAAGSYHYERSVLPKVGGRLRRHGAEVARRLNEHMFAGGADPVDENFLKLSLQLNASAAGHAERRRFVSGIDAALATGAPLDAWMDAYVRTGSLDEILAPVLRLVEEQTEGRRLL